ncbi:MAG: hypothetical protein ABIR68_15860 [Ilumatobacteraceae bacterium]
MALARAIELLDGWMLVHERPTHMVRRRRVHRHQLRDRPPAKAMTRIVVEAHERDGHRFTAGQNVYLDILAANRDPRAFAAPHRLDRTCTCTCTCNGPPAQTAGATGS